MNDCILASSNRKKVAELSDILGNFGLHVVAQSALDIKDAEETGTTFIENAIIKARHAARISGKAALADDSGLCVNALGGAPGVYSARYAGEHGNDDANNQKLLTSLASISDRSAYFVCVIVYLRHADDPLPLIAQGVWHGDILHAPRGDKGFGYDPLFYLPEHQQTAAEMDSALKNRISHRARALTALSNELQHEFNAK